MTSRWWIERCHRRRASGVRVKSDTGHTSLSKALVDTLNTIFSDSKYNSSLFVCGHYNIDLLKNGEHVGTTKVIDAMYSIGLYPLIDKTCRITQYSAT